MMNFFKLSLTFLIVIINCSVFAATTLEEKIGQMMMVGFQGMSVDENHFIIQDIKKRNLGGVILFDYDVVSAKRYRNIESPSQVKALIKSLQKASDSTLLIAVDQEGGLIARLKEMYGFPKTRSHMELGGHDDLQLTFNETVKLAKTLADAGFNLNMAPVVDLCVNLDNPIIAKKERCFSDDPEKVTAQAGSYIDALHSQNILSTLKHFPGHGSSKGDSHLGLTDVTKTWTEKELIPYKNLISEGKADVIMTAHVFNSQIDPQYPATLSKEAIEGILRQRLGFDGVVVSDDMQMGAIVNQYGFETAIQKAVEAGVDILVFGNNLHYDEKIVPRVISIIKKMVQDGTITEKRIETSYQRIINLKYRLK
ncbi:MAG: glycoside hydrolase family 3 [Denitrovibrio sp.]|nr:MAG: glycoside hydrolase family 3 [Denitrovibrio sp.]